MTTPLYRRRARCWNAIGKSLVAMLLLHTEWNHWKGGIMTTLLHKVIVAVAVASSSVVVAVSPPQNTVARTDALRVFGQRMAAYSELHRRSAASVSPLRPTADVNEILQRQADLWGAIVMARPNARQGDIFDPAVASAFRGIIAEALAGIDSAAMLRDLLEESDLVGYRPHVNTGYPEGGTHEMPSVLLAALPALPEGIVYRLIDLNLVLWDMDADLIVDVLPDALPSEGS
jgi:hypothetical protein